MIKITGLWFIILGIAVGQAWGQNTKLNPELSYKTDIKSVKKALDDLVECKAVSHRLTPNIILTGLLISVSGTLIQKLWSNEPFQKLRLLKTVKASVLEVLEKFDNSQHIELQQQIINKKLDIAQSLKNSAVEAGVLMYKEVTATDPTIRPFDEIEPMYQNMRKHKFQYEYLRDGKTSNSLYQEIIKRNPQYAKILAKIRENYLQVHNGVDPILEKLEQLKLDYRKGKIGLRSSLINLLNTINENEQALLKQLSHSDFEQIHIRELNRPSIEGSLNHLSKLEYEVSRKVNSFKVGRWGAWGLVPALTFIAVLVSEHRDANQIAGGIMFENQPLADLSEVALFDLVRQCIDNYGVDETLRLINDIYTKYCVK